jgi:hypothetical protein
MSVHGNFSLFSQANVWMVPVDANNVYLRLPQSTLFDSISIDLSVAGKVFTRFEGNCTSTPGDLIVLAASNYNDWNPMMGTQAVTVIRLERMQLLVLITPGVYMWKPALTLFTLWDKIMLKRMAVVMHTISGNFL